MQLSVETLHAPVLPWDRRAIFRTPGTIASPPARPSPARCQGREAPRPTDRRPLVQHRRYQQEVAGGATKSIPHVSRHTAAQDAVLARADPRSFARFPGTSQPSIRYSCFTSRVPTEFGDDLAVSLVVSLQGEYRAILLPATIQQ